MTDERPSHERLVEAISDTAALLQVEMYVVDELLIAVLSGVRDMEERRNG